VLFRPYAAHPGLLLAVHDPHQWGRLGPRVLPASPPRVLHHVPGAEHPVLSEPLFAALVAASVAAGLTTLFGP
jgi:hypothetical protein